MTKNGHGRVGRLLRALAAAAAGLTLVVGIATPSAAAQTWYDFINGKGDGGFALFLTVSGGLKAQATVKTEVAGGSQLWTYQDSGGYVFLRSGNSTQQYALSILDNNHANKTPVVQYTYQPTNDYQKWTREFVANGGWYRFRNLATGRCLAVLGGTASTLPSGSGVIIYDCGSGQDQVWQERHISG